MKADALNNKLKYLDVLCFPTVFPSGKSRPAAITVSEYAMAVYPVRVLSPLAERDARNLCWNIQHAQEYTAVSNACGRICHHSVEL